MRSGADPPQAPRDDVRGGGKLACGCLSRLPAGVGDVCRWAGTAGAPRPTQKPGEAILYAIYFGSTARAAIKKSAKRE